jgi:hypothetical protein
VASLAVNAAFNRVLGGFTVLCPWYADEGCEWRGKYDNMDGHYGRCKLHRNAVIDTVIPAINRKLLASLLSPEELKKAITEHGDSRWKARVSHAALAWLRFWRLRGVEPPASKDTMTRREFTEAIHGFLFRSNEFVAVYDELGIPHVPYWHDTTVQQLEWLADLMTVRHHDQPEVPLDKVRIKMALGSVRGRLIHALLGCYVQVTFLLAFQYLLPSSELGGDDEESPALGPCISLLWPRLVGPDAPALVKGKFFPKTDRNDAMHRVVKEAREATRHLGSEAVGWLLRLSGNTANTRHCRFFC